MRASEAADQIESRLELLGDPIRAAGEKRYLKSELAFLGVTVPAVRKAVREWLRQHPDLTRRQLLALCRALWRRPVHELRSFAVFLLEARVDSLEAGDLRLVERMLRGANTWAHVDALAIQVAGPLVERFRLTDYLDRWAEERSYWLRRSAMLALLLPLRRGEGDWPRFAGYADRMLEEKEFFIRKAIGWVLREVSKKRPDRVRRFVQQHMERISGVTLREAVRYLSPDDRQTLLEAYRSR